MSRNIEEPAMDTTSGQYGGSLGITIGRLVVGLIWIAGAVFNLLVTLRMERPFEWLEASPVPFYRWFFADVAGAHPALWTVLLVAGETALGVLTLWDGARARLGLAGGALFSAFLFSLAPPYTLVMGPYAVFVGWLARKPHSQSIRQMLRQRGTQQEPAAIEPA